MGATPPSRLIVPGEVPLSPALPPVADRVRVQTHPSSCLHMGQEGRRRQQQHQAGALAPLVLNRSVCDEWLAWGHKSRGEIGAIRWQRSRHDVHPFEKGISVPIRCPHRLPQRLSQLTLELFVKRSTKSHAP